MVRYVIVSIRKSLLSSIIIFFLIAGTGIYLKYFRNSEPYYKSDMALMHSGLHKKAIGEMVEKLNILARNESYSQLAQTLQLPEEQVKNVTGIEAKNIHNQPLQEDASPEEENEPVYITVMATERDVFQPLESALLNYLNGNPYQALRNRLEIERLNRKTQFQEQDMRKIDSILNSYPVFLANTKVMADSSSGLTNIVSLLAYKDKLEDDMLKAEISKNFQKTAELMHGFLPPDKPLRYNENVSLWLFLIAAFVGMCVWAVLVNAIRNAG